MNIDRRHFYTTLVSIAIPITLQNVISSSLNLVDTIMIGQLGTIEIAAVGLANRFYFILILVLFAVSSGTAIFTAQFWGKKDIQHIGKVMGIALVLSIFIAAIFSLGALLIPDLIMKVFTEDTEVITEGSHYLWIVAFSYILTAVTMLYSFILRSIEQVKLPMYASIIGLGLNTFLNYCLIFGHVGFPALGVRGAAIATLIARIIETGVIVFVTYWKKYPAVKPADLFAIPLPFIKQFLVTTLPVVANEFSWVMGMTMYSIVFGRMGTAEVAAINMVNPVEQVFSYMFFGVASAASVMIGNQIGAEHEELAFSYAKRFSGLGIVGGLLSGGGIFLSATYIASVFKVSQDVRTFAINTLIVLSLVMWIRIFNMITIVGILRSGGDTKFSLYIEMIGIWGIGVPLAFLGGLVWKVPVYWVFALVNIEELFKMLVGLYRIYSKKWIHNLVSFAEFNAPSITSKSR